MVWCRVFEFLAGAGMSGQSIENGAMAQHRMLVGEKEYESAIDEVIGQARHTLHIFDSDLSKGEYASEKRYEALRKFLLMVRGNRLVLVLHETDYLVSRCPRLMGLLRLFSHAISIHRTLEHARVASDHFVIADEAHHVHRFHGNNARFLLALHDYAGTRQLEERFGQLLESSCPAVFATTLGL
jgi:hypothetical protein